MAALAIHTDMFPGQLECGESMIEGPIFPRTGIMTGRAFRPKTAFMEIILLMARNTFRRRLFEKVIRVAFPAGHFHMHPNQFETRLVMIVLNGFPGLRRMTFGTIRTQTPGVRIILLVAGKTGLRSDLQIRNFSRTKMTLRTKRKHMTAG